MLALEELAVELHNIQFLQWEYVQTFEYLMVEISSHKR